jgi:glycosyltransferase involved in cell wall biosynthesis
MGFFKTKKLKFSFIVSVYNMHREIERTLYSLSKDYQRDSGAIEYEVIVVDNGSQEQLDPSLFKGKDNIHYLYVGDGNQSPVCAINQAAAQARGEILVLMIDGARMLSPGVLAWANRAFSLFPNPVVSVLGFHLGPEHQAVSAGRGYCQKVEDELLQAMSWREDGYRLFEISSLAGSAKDAWYNSVAESNCLFMRRSMYRELGGYEERFSTPGGGLCNLDLYSRAVEFPGVELVSLHGEGCFHQYHGGVTTGGETEGEKLTFDDLAGEYEAIRGKPYRLSTVEATLFGHTPMNAVPQIIAGATNISESVPSLGDGAELAYKLMKANWECETS